MSKVDSIFNFKSIKKQDTLKYLKEKYPDENWKAKKSGFGWTYENNKGDKAWWCSALSPRYDGDDDNFMLQFHIYRKNKTPERIW
jgi:hypothetical protein